MKSAITTSALSSLFSPVQVLSAQKLHALSIVTNREESRAKKDKIQAENESKLAWEKKSLRLKNRVKAKLDLKTKVRHDDWYLHTTEDECIPFEYSIEEYATKRYEGNVDVGILKGCDNPYLYCIEDTSSSLGGVCAQAIDTDKKVRATNKSSNMASVDKEDEVHAVVGDKEKGITNSHTIVTNELKLVNMKDNIKARRILKDKKSVGEESSSLIGEECHLGNGNNPGFVDVGILNRCGQVGHVCIEHYSSTLGGVCVDIGSDVEEEVDSFRRFNQSEKSLFTACTYKNGTSGEKCSGHRACGGLSDSFINTNIGCGSCNAYSACRGLTGESIYFKILGSLLTFSIDTVSYLFTMHGIIHIESSSVGEQSCNGGNACRYDRSTGKNRHAKSIKQISGMLILLTNIKPILSSSHR